MKIWKNHIFFSHGKAWRKEENAESVLKFSEEIISLRLVLAGHGLG